jgi:hypothetical protein
MRRFLPGAARLERLVLFARVDGQHAEPAVVHWVLAGQEGQPAR